MSRRLGWGRVAAGAAFLAVAAPAVAGPVEPESVSLATDAGDAPVLEPGVYDSRLPAVGSTGYVALNRSIPGSTLWVGETLRIKDTRYGVLQYQAHPADDVQDQVCHTVSGMASEYEQDPLLSSAMMIDAEKCGSDADLVISTSNQEYASTALAPDTPFQLAFWEEPPSRDPSVLPPPATTVKWTGEVQPARGRETLGNTFAEAPELVNGRWEVHVAPEQFGLFRVPLDWGEHVEVEMVYRGAEVEEYVPINAALLTPLGGEVDWAEATGAPDLDYVSLGLAGRPGGVASPSISWRNREPGTENHAAFPGVYYVNLHMRPEDAPPKGVDLTISVQVVRDRETATPYAEQGLPAPDLGGHGEFAAEVAAEAARESESANADGPADDAPPWSLVGALFGGSAAMAVAGGVALGRYRRSGAV